MGNLASGTFLLLVGGTLAVLGAIPPLPGLGWTLVALGCVLIVAHVAVGPTRAS